MNCGGVRGAFRVCFVATGFFVFVLVAPAAAQESPSGGTLDIAFVDVGAGDAAIYRGPCGEASVIDVADGGAIVVGDTLRSMEVRKLEWTVASHYDEDHIGAFEELAESFPMGAVYDRGGGPRAKLNRKGDGPSAPYTDYYKWANATKVRTTLKPGRVLTLCSGADEVRFEVVAVNGATSAAQVTTQKNENSKSVCLLVVFRRFRELTCGDATTPVEDAIAPIVGHVQLLKVSHHGSSTSTSKAFVQAICPTLAVISVGHEYGHPKTDVVTNLRECASVYQTGGQTNDGTIRLSTDGAQWMEVSTERQPSVARYPLAAGDSEGRPTEMPTNVVIGVCVAYALAVLLIKQYRVVAPRDWLIQRLSHLQADVIRPSTPDDVKLNDAETQIKETLAQITRAWPLLPVSRVQAGWRAAHAIEDRGVLNLTVPSVDERLATMRSRLKTIDATGADDLEQRIGVVLDGADDARAATTIVDRKRELLYEAATYWHNLRDSAHEDMSSWLGKVVWLVMLSLALVTGLANQFDHEVYFLLGAAGALLSRLTRALKQAPRRDDYGASWSELVLSPAAGAVAGWVGVLLLSTLSQPPFGLVGDTFESMWTEAAAPLGLLAAFVFGFSERLFDRLVGSATEGLSKGLGPTAEKKGDDRHDDRRPNRRRRSTPDTNDSATVDRGEP